MNFEKLEVWQRSARLSANVYKLTATLKDYGFRDQLTRSGLSVPSNIAEGMTRISEKERIRFLDIARASMSELRTQVYIGMDIGYIPTDTAKDWIQESKEISAMISGLMRQIQNNQ